MKLLIVLGTRPEAIKLAPVVLAARAEPGIDVTVCNTGQHADMCHAALATFGIVPEIDLKIMKPRQGLTEISTAVLKALHPLLAASRPDWLVVQGDTTTAFAAALAGFYGRVRVAHVEAGLRTGNPEAPWPEEMNRRLIAPIASLHFAPLASNAANLRREGIADQDIRVTGNTGIDAIKWLVRRFDEDKGLMRKADARLASAGVAPSGPLVLVTGHRRENIGEGFRAVCQAIAELARRFPARQFIYPVHPNPAVRDTVQAMLGTGSATNIVLTEPLDYTPFVRLMTRAELILTDSGGIQEEAPSIGIRVVVLREATERPEALETGFVRLAGTNAERIVAHASDALDGRWQPPAQASDVFGDGHAAHRILEALATAERRPTSI
ncbi:MAG TPA: UDP-N-acetylglucosamine 2-epimerase (non-hydrolyzing) [Stellaceae bacterium]|nr:UDP-N-acetylglucosamine 2-epimerase (non-hydrolyzing) [Stellaceae bacterium]